jgi:hypothetical protein
MAQVDSRDAVFRRLLAFLNRLDVANASYRLGHTRADSVMVEIALPGWRWELEFMADGAVEIERTCRSLESRTSRTCWRSCSLTLKVTNGQRHEPALGSCGGDA